MLDRDGHGARERMGKGEARRRIQELATEQTRTNLSLER